MSAETPTPAPPGPHWIERLDPVTLALAAFSVGLYLAELGGLVGGAWVVAVSTTVDCLFVLDLAVKVAVLRGPYVRSPWFLVDAISCLPVLSSLARLPGAVNGLRFVRAFRVLRALRSLRLLRTLSVLRLKPSRTAYTRRYELALSASVVAFTVVFVALVASTGGNEREEMYLVLGSVLGMLLVLFVVRFQIQDITHGHIRQLLSAALPKQVAEHFLEHPDSYDATVHMPATVIFCDIRGFTATVEALGGDMVRLKHHLERAMDAVVAAHLRHDLLIDKLIGDAVMSFRGGNMVEGTAEEHAVRVVKAALEAVVALEALGDPYFKRIKVGGASAESAMIGTFGTSDRLSYTILGDRVNVAARLEAACGQVRATNLFDTATRELVGDDKGIGWRRVGRLKVSGKKAYIEAWQAFDGAVDLSWVPLYDAAIQLFEAGEMEAAREAFERVLREVDEDGPSRVFWASSRHLSGQELPADWDGALEMAK